MPPRRSRRFAICICTILERSQIQVIEIKAAGQAAKPRGKMQGKRRILNRCGIEVMRICLASSRQPRRPANSYAAVSGRPDRITPLVGQGHYMPFMTRIKSRSSSILSG